MFQKLNYLNDTHAFTSISENNSFLWPTLYIALDVRNLRPNFTAYRPVQRTDCKSLLNLADFGPNRWYMIRKHTKNFFRAKCCTPRV